MAAVRRRWARRSANSATATPAAMPPMPSTAQRPISSNTGAAIAERVDDAAEQDGLGELDQAQGDVGDDQQRDDAALVAQQAERAAVGAQQGPDRAGAAQPCAARRFGQQERHRHRGRAGRGPVAGRAVGLDQLGEVAVGAAAPRPPAARPGTGRSRRRPGVRRRGSGRARAGGPWRPRSGAAGSGRARRRGGASPPGRRRRGRRRSCGRGGARWPRRSWARHRPRGAGRRSSGRSPRTRWRSAEVANSSFISATRRPANGASAASAMTGVRVRPV